MNEIKKYLSEIGKRGGAAGRGSKKIRGTAEYYADLGRAGAKSRAKKNLKKSLYNATG
ncbi:MAG TPA: hypothetical protein V6D12_14085 [Candidatus Obscuribacterales bacterium]